MRLLKVSPIGRVVCMVLSTVLLAACGQSGAIIPQEASIPVPEPPTSGSTAFKSTATSLTVNMSWDPSAGATSYRLQVSADPTFTNVIIDQAGIADAHYEATSGLQWKSDYYWRVNASNSSGTSPWSRNWKFHTPLLPLEKIVYITSKSSKDSDFPSLETEVRVINADGSNNLLLAEIPVFNSLEWSHDGTSILYSSIKDIYVTNPDGSKKSTLTSVQGQNHAATYSPDGTKIAFDVTSATSRDISNFEIYVSGADGSYAKNLTANLICDILPTWSPDSKKIAYMSIRSAKRDSNVDIYLMNADGSNRKQLTNDPSFNGLPVWSPDGTKMAFMSTRGGTLDIYIMNADGTNQQRIAGTVDNAYNYFPAWSPDGTKIAFISDGDSGVQIHVINVEGSNYIQATVVTVDDYVFPNVRQTAEKGFYMDAWGYIYYIPSKQTPRNTIFPIPINKHIQPLLWSPDSNRIAFVSKLDGNFEICVTSTSSSGSNVTRLTRNSANDIWPAWSPDGTRIAFSSDRDGNYEIYTMNADGSNQIRLTNSPDDDGNPIWR